MIHFTFTSLNLKETCRQSLRWTSNDILLISHIFWPHIYMLTHCGLVTTYGIYEAGCFQLMKTPSQHCITACLCTFWPYSQYSVTLFVRFPNFGQAVTLMFNGLSTDKDDINVIFPRWNQTALFVSKKIVKVSSADPFLLWWFWKCVYFISYRHQIKTMNYSSLFRARSWNNGVFLFIKSGLKK